MNGRMHFVIPQLRYWSRLVPTLVGVSNLWTVLGPTLALVTMALSEPALADPDETIYYFKHLTEAVAAVPRAERKKNALQSLSEFAKPYSEKALNEEEYGGLVSGVEKLERQYGVAARGFRGLISEPTESITEPHIVGTSASEEKNYGPTVASLKGIVQASTEVQVGLIPAITQELSERKDQERDRALQEQAQYYQNYGGPFGRSPQGGGSSQGGSGGGKTGGGSGAKSEPLNFNLPDSGFGNALESLRGEETRIIQTPPANFPDNGIFPEIDVGKSVSLPKLASKSTGPIAETSASPILKNLQMLSGNRSNPGLAIPPNALDGGFPSPGQSEGSPSLKATAPKSESLGEPSVSPDDTNTEPRFNFSAKAPDSAASADEDGTSFQATPALTLGASGAESKNNLNREVLPLGPADEKGRSWIFSYAPSKIIRNSCATETQSLIRIFCIGVKRRLAQLTVN